MTIDDTFKHNLLVNIARLYYLHGLTHQQIADRLGLSRVKVTRLLQKAVESGIVEFRIADPAVSTLELGDRLEKTFGLRQALVTPPPQSPPELVPLLAHYAGRCLIDHIKEGTVVGLGWGRTVDAVCEQVDRVRTKDVAVVSLTGGLAANKDNPNPYDVASRFAARIGASPYYLLLPVIVESAQSREILKNESHFREIYKLWERLDVCLVSIGRLAPDTGFFYAFDKPGQQFQQVRDIGGVGDILARPFDRAGTFLETGFSDRTITIDFDLLRRASVVIGVAGGGHKVESILGALRTGVLTVLVIDEPTAQLVLEAVAQY